MAKAKKKQVNFAVKVFRKTRRAVKAVIREFGL
jgi:hypothetical protein